MAENLLEQIVVTYQDLLNFTIFVVKFLSTCQKLQVLSNYLIIKG